MTATLAERLAPFAVHVVHVRTKVGGRARLYVGRGQPEAGRFGNPFVMADHSEAERLRVVGEFARHVRDMDPAERELLLAPIREVLEAGGVLACFCAPKLCHAQVWAAFALDEVTRDDLHPPPIRDDAGVAARDLPRCPGADAAPGD